MANIGTFGSRRGKRAINDTIIFCEEKLQLQRLDAFALTEFTEVLGSMGNMAAIEETLKGEANAEALAEMSSALGLFAAATSLIRKALVPESFKRFRELSEENEISTMEVFEVAMHLFGWASAFPTEGQSDSSSLPASNGQNSNDSFSVLSSQLNASATSE